MTPATRRWESYVYFLQRTDGEQLVKIGCTRRPEVRRRELERSTGAALRDLGILVGNLDTEQSLHQRFHYLHRGQEWFLPAPELLACIEALAVTPWTHSSTLDSEP